jgi:mono/diheme cytochrome c family protein
MKTLTKIGLGTLALAMIAVPAAGSLAVAPEEAAATLTDEQVAKGRQLFTDNGCNACHTLADANAAGSVGPAFDGNANLDKAHVVNIVTNGQGAMPSFGWLGEEDIDLIAGYIVQVKK